MSMAFADILLSTYNGEQYLAELLESIAGQTCPDWRLLVRDDGSTDRTVDIIKSFGDRLPGKVQLIREPDGNIGTVRSFSALLARSDADYIMFADQDDVWLPDKVAVTLERMQKLEQKHGSDTACLVHTDLTVVDENLAVIADSFWTYQRVNPGNGRILSRMLVANTATGCAAMINKRLKDLALPVPPEAVMHDWWLALVAAALGRVDYLPQPTILYRQHPANTLGAKKSSLFINVRKALSFRENTRDVKAYLLRLQGQAAVLAGRYEHTLRERDYRAASTFATIRSHNPLVRRYLIFKHRFFMTGMFQNISLLLRI